MNCENKTNSCENAYICHCLFYKAKNKNNKCEHEWKHIGTTVIDPDGWYYNQPCYKETHICLNCGEKMYIKK